MPMTAAPTTTTQDMTLTSTGRRLAKPHQWFRVRLATLTASTDELRARILSDELPDKLQRHILRQRYD
jgi:hypothetical protein